MKNAALLLLIVLLAACGNGKVDTSQLKEEMKAREIRVIPKATIIEKTMSLGDSLVQQLDAEAAMAQAGTAIKTWTVSENSFSATAYSLNESYELAEKEAGVLAAYQYNAENNITAEPNAQKLPGDLIVYNAPIIVDEKLVGMWSIQLPRKYVILSIED